MSLEIRNVAESEINNAAALCAKAFIESPSYVDIYKDGGDETWREKELEWLFATHFRVMFAKDPLTLRGGFEDGRIVCFFMFVPSSLHITLLEKLYYGFFALPVRVGWKIYCQLTETSNHFDTIYAEIVSGRRCLELMRMVVHPDHQGKGIGSKCLAAALKDADRWKLPVRLSTQLDINVRFYSKLGFQVVRESDFTSTGKDEESYHSYFMIRESQS